MRRVTVIVEPEDLASRVIRLEGETYHHLFRVRRLGRGQELRLVDGRGAAVAGRVVEVKGRSAEVEVGPPVATNEPLLDLELWVAPPRARRGNWLVEKATELGVHAVRLLASDRAVREFSDAATGRLQRVAASAVEQCHRARIPEISGPHSWSECLERLSTTTWILSSEGRFSYEAPQSGRMALLVGPEGGWTEAEVTQAEAAGARVVGLGSRVLRVETAAVVVAGLILVGK